MEVYRMKKYHIINNNNEILWEVYTTSSRNALIMYLLDREDYSIDICIFQDAFSHIWKVCEYDNEDEYLIAKEVPEEELRDNMILSKNISNIEKIKLLFNRDKVLIRNRVPALYYLMLEFLDSFKK